MSTIKEFHLFAGIGGGIYGGHILGHSCCGAVEIDDYCKEVLEQRQQDGWMDSFPIYGDITSLNGRNFKGAFDILCGGFPCQAFSYVARGQNISEKNLWPEMLRFVWESEAPIVFAENFSELKNEVVTNRRAQLKAIGNAQAPLVAATAFRILAYRHKNQIRNSVKVLKEEINRFFTVQPTWIKDTYGENFGFVHTPTTMANYSAPSMMKHAGCRNFVEVFNRPTPANAEYLMGLPQGASTANSMSKKNMEIWLQKLRQATKQRDLSSEE